MNDRAADLPFDLKSLEVFLAVCDHGSMADAARALEVTQPAVSLAISELERKMGTQLFDRAVRPLALTAAGVLLRQRAAALMADAREIPSLLRGTVQGKVPLLRIGLVDSLSRALTVDIARYLGNHSEVVSVLSGLTAAHASALLTRRLDIFVGVDDLEETPGLERWELIKEPYVLLQNSTERTVKNITDFKRLAGSTPLIRFSARSQTGLEIEGHLRRLGLEIRQSYEFDTPYAVAAMVASGAGFAITTPLCLAEAQVEYRMVQMSPLPGPKISRTLTLVARQRELGLIPKKLAERMRGTLTRTIAQVPGARE